MTNDATLRFFTDEVIRKGLVTSHQLKGCTEEEISALEREFSVRLPATYRSFLQLVGRESERLFAGEDVTYEHLRRLQRAAARAAEDGGWTLPRDVFVFWAHQSDQFFYFITAEGSDPPIYGFADGDSSAEIVAPSLTRFLEDWVSDA